MPLRMIGRGRGSGAALEGDEAALEGDEVHTMRLREGKIIEAREYREKSEGLKTVGLEGQAMSQENVEALRRYSAAGWEDDWDTMAAIMDPHIVVRTNPRWPEQIIYGREAVLGWFRGLQESGGGDIRFEEMLDLGDRVLARVRCVFHGKLSDAEGEQRTSVIYTFRDGRIILEEFFFEHEDALKAVGLAEQAVSENLDLVRSIYTNWERGDFGSATWADPQIEFVFADGPSPGRWTGVPGMREGFRDFLTAWESIGVESAEYRELDPERVLAMVSFSGSGKASGVELRLTGQRGANLFHIRDGKVTRLVLYWDRDRALADLGLEGQAVSREPEAAPIRLHRVTTAERGDDSLTLWRWSSQ